MPAPEQSAQAALLEKNWEIVQKIIGDLVERSWKIRAWAITVWWAVIGYAMTNTQPRLILFLAVFLIIAFLIDATTRVMVDRYFDLTHRIEKALTAFAAYDNERAAAQEITTNVAVADWRAFKDLLHWRRFTVWFPYLAIEALTVLAYFAVLGSRPAAP